MFMEIKLKADTHIAHPKPLTTNYEIARFIMGVKLTFIRFIQYFRQSMLFIEYNLFLNKASQYESRNSMHCLTVIDAQVTNYNSYTVLSTGLCKLE